MHGCIDVGMNVDRTRADITPFCIDDPALTGQIRSNLNDLLPGDPKIRFEALRRSYNRPVLDDEIHGSPLTLIAGGIV
jgi:hypothetical protein